jgi:O-antigen ligase
MLRAGLAMAYDHPLTGVGPGQVKHLYPRYAPPEAVRRYTSHLHDAPLQILVERGVPGLAAWLAIFAAFVARVLGARPRAPEERPEDRALALGCLAAVVAFVVAGLFEYNFGDTEVLLVAVSLMAVPFVIERDRRRS